MENFIKGYNLFEIEKMVLEKAGLIGLSGKELPGFGGPEFDTQYYIVVMKDGYYYTLSDRGNISDKMVTTDIDELMFWILRDATFFRAFDYELKHRIENQDTRIIGFKKHIEILESLSLKQNFIDKLKEKYNKLLNQKIF